jgi:predicted PurR-regulated permease PerM
LLLVGGIVGMGLAVAPTLSSEAKELQERIPKAVESVRDRLSRSAPGGQQIAQKAPEAIKQAGEKAVPALIALVSGITSIILVIVLAAFLVSAPDVYRKGVRALIPPAHEEKFDESWRRVGQSLRKWVGGILVSMTIMGGLTAIGLKIAGIQGWLLLGVLTFLGTFIPYVGAVASAVPGLLAALAQSPRHFLWAGVVYIGVHHVEGYVVQPFVMKRAVEVKPALLLFGQGLFTAIFGLMGTVVATPLIVCGQTLIDYLWVERRLGKKPTK